MCFERQRLHVMVEAENIPYGVMCESLGSLQAELV